MRLIDADALHINITCGRMNGKMEFADAVKAMINNAPTVDAIPVTFIKEQLENLQGIADNEFIESGGYFGICNHKLWALEDLLNHWAEREEHETN